MDMFGPRKEMNSCPLPSKLNKKTTDDGWPKFRHSQEFLFTVRPARRPPNTFRHLLCGYSPIGLNTVTRCRKWITFSRWHHEPMALNESQARTRCVVADWLEH